MPLYEYRCKKCGKKFDVRQKISDDDLTVHDVCGGEVERLVSAPAFHFKGSGWYVTDYAKSNPGTKPAAKPSEPVESKPAAPTSTTTSKN